MSDELLYLYAIADAAASGAIVAARLTGIDGGRVAPVVEGRLLGATSVVPASEYDEAPLNEHLQDLDWLAPRAAAHQDVNGRLLEITGGIVPRAYWGERYWVRPASYGLPWAARGTRWLRVGPDAILIRQYDGSVRIS